MDIIKSLAQEFKLRENRVADTVKLIDEGNTIPFIARYRKEVTGELDDQTLRELNDRLEFLRALEQRKEDVKRLITENAEMTEEIETAIDNAKTLTELEDIYRPFRPKRRTRATIAKEKGLEPLAELIYAQNLIDGSVEEIVTPFLSEDVLTIEDALAGAMDIIAEQISDNAEFRKTIRQMTISKGIIESKATKQQDSVYNMYYEYKEPISKIAKHRVLALDRGEKEEFLAVKIVVDETAIIEFLFEKNLSKNRSITTQYVELACEDSHKRLISPSIEREVRGILTEEAGEQAIKVFAQNLKSLLLQPPIKDRVVLGFDPGYRTGCKTAVVDGTGKVLDTDVIYCTLEHHDKEIAKQKLLKLIDKHNVDIISIGNGTASNESETFIASIIKEIPRKIYYMVVNEAGASVYSASKLAAEEFPQFDVSLRSAVSIARRLQDPLAELVKIDPKAIGVGQYQHDMNQKRLNESLGGVVEDCVNSVGVDLNTASAPLLSFISGINNTVSKNIVEYREKNGRFNSRKQLLKVAKLGEKAFVQCAGFLRIPGGENIMDNTSVHPESYLIAQKLIKQLGFSLEDVSTGQINGIKDSLSKMNLIELSEQLSVGVPTIKDIADALEKRGLDPRDELPQPMLRSDVMSIEDLSIGMVLSGTVRNAIDFGVFVDIGVHQDGLVHISQICDKYIKHPTEVVSVGDIVQVKVIDVDISRKRISLSMKI